MRSCFALLCLFAAGCAVGPDYVRPPVAVPDQYKGAGDWQPARPRDDSPRGNWWEVFGDAQLNAFIAEANAANQSLAAAEAQLRAALAAAAAARSVLFPTLSATVSETRSRPSASTAGPTTGVRTLYNASLGTSWEVDLWGKVRRAAESGDATVQASAADLVNARLSVQAGIAQTYFQLRGVDRQLRLLDESIAGYSKSLELTRLRLSAGVVSRADVLQAETLLNATRAQRIDLGVQRAQLEQALALLLGKPASVFSFSAAPLDAQPPAIPASLPAELLERRPDIAAAERRVAAANAQIGVARAAWFPSLTLNAAYGYQNSTTAQLFSVPNRFWSVGPALAEVIFDGGRRGALTDQAIALHDVAVANYRQTVLAAFGEVENNLAALRMFEEESSVQAEAVRAAEQALEIVLNQYRAGVASYLQVVTAQTTALANQRAAADLQVRRMVVSVALIRALGGGWADPRGSAERLWTGKP